jgi:hypothetical protein
MTVLCLGSVGNVLLFTAVAPRSDCLVNLLNGCQNNERDRFCNMKTGYGRLATTRIQFYITIHKIIIMKLSLLNIPN